MLYYLYCIKLGKSDQEFWHSTLALIFKMIDMYTDEKAMEAAAYREESYQSHYFGTGSNHDVIEISSMKQIGVC